LRRPPARTRRSDDTGFTLTETMISLFVVAVMLLGLVYAQSAATLSIARAKQRQQATQLANQIMEKVRAIPWVTLSAGLNSDDLAGDGSVSGGRFRPTYTTGIDEELVTSASQDQPPLNPHLHQVTLGTATYLTGVYLTKTAEWTASEPVLWLTVVTTRVSGPGEAFRPVALRSQVYSPNGCLSTSVRPYSGPCQAFFYGSAATLAGRIWLDQDGADAIPELGVSKAELAMPAVSVSAQAEQTASLDASALTSGIVLQGSSASTSAGKIKARVTADDDPSSVLPSDPAPVTAAQSAAAATTGGTFGAVTLTPSTTGQAEAMVGENSGPTVPCRDLAGLTTSAGLPCGSAVFTELATQSITVNPEPLAGRGLGTFTLVTLTPPTGSVGPGQAWTARLPQTQNGHCTALTSTGTVGCISAQAERGISGLVLGGLPSTNSADTLSWSTGVAFQGMVDVTGYTTSAESEQGIGAGAPAGSRSATIAYWNGSGYTTAALGTAGLNTTLGTASIGYKSGPSTMTITVNGTLTADAVTTTAWPTPDCATAACVTTTRVPAVVARITYEINVDGTPVATFAVNADLGTVLASTTYRAAPSE
jgi:hypothetical protein